MTDLKVAVVGGSIGGLTVALLLRDLGCEVEVHERSTSPLEARGAGIAVLPETVRYLTERGALDAADVCTTTSVVRYLGADGSTAFEEDRPHRFSSWNAIYRALLERFGHGRYHLSHPVRDVVGRADGATVVLEDGRTHDVDLVVCADGIRSGSRARLLPDVAPSYAGYVAWRGVVPEGELEPATLARLGDALTYQLLDESHILVYPIPSLTGGLAPGERLANFVWYRNVASGADLDALLTDRHGRVNEVSVPPGAVAEAFVAEARAYASAHLAPPIAEVVTGAADPFVQAIFDVEVPRMVFGRVAIAGDAAFAARPHAAAGTAKAADDAWALAEELARTDDVDAALAAWERRQLAVGSALVARTQAIGRRSQFDGSWVPGDPELAFGLHGPNR